MDRRARMTVALATAAVMAVAAPGASAAVKPKACSSPDVGGKGTDVVQGDSGPDCVDGRAGHDRLHGRQGADRIYGRQGNDRVTGGHGRDRIDGGIGHDRLSGGHGHDRIVAGLGADRVQAGPGTDFVDVRDGRADTVNCGAGNDVVVGDREDRLVRCERPRLGASPSASGSAAAANMVLQRLADIAPDNHWGRIVKDVASITKEADILGPIREIQVQLTQMQQQLYTLQNDVARLNEDLLQTHFDTLVRGFAGGFVSKVAEAQKRLAEVANPDSTVSKTARIAAFKTYMASNQLDFKLVEFEDLIDQPGGIIDAASKVARSRDGFFFKAEHSHEARAVYDYYALVQANALTAIANYWHLTQGEKATYPYNDENYVRAFLADHAKRIRDQAKRLKPALPPATLLQKRSGILWRHLYSAPYYWSGGVTYFPSTYSRVAEPVNDRLAVDDTRLSYTQFGGTLYKFILPSRADIDQLVTDGVGAGPGQWLVEHGFPPYLFYGRSDQRTADRCFWVDEPPPPGGWDVICRVIPWSARGWGWPEWTGIYAQLIPLWAVKVNTADYYY